MKKYLGFGKDTSDDIATDPDTWIAAAESAPVSKDVKDKVRLILGMRELLKDGDDEKRKGKEKAKERPKERPHSSPESDGYGPGEALSAEELNAVATKIEQVAGYMESIPKEDVKTHRKMLYAIVDTVDKSSAMAVVRAAWKKIPSEVKSVIAASPETSSLLSPLGPLVHFLVKSGLLSHDEAVIQKGEELKEDAINVGKWAAKLYKPLLMLEVLAKPILKVVSMQNKEFAALRQHLQAKKSSKAQIGINLN